MNSEISSSTSDSVAIRAQFDGILKKHITRLIEIDSTSELAFDLINVSCLILLVEKEKEIKKFPDSPPERYNRETLLYDLVQLGVRIDVEPEGIFLNLVHHGYVGIDAEGRYNAQIPAFALVNFLDNLFPEMQGIHLVAYVLQFIDEVLSGRKDIETAKAVFDQTLLTRGVALSEQKSRKIENNGRGPEPKDSKASGFLKKNNDAHRQDYVQKLSRLRSKKADARFAKPAVITQSGVSSRKIKIKEVFPKTDPEIVAVQSTNDDNRAEDESRTNTAPPSSTAPLVENTHAVLPEAPSAASVHQFDSQNSEPDSVADANCGSDDKDDNIKSEFEVHAAEAADETPSVLPSEVVSEVHAAKGSDSQFEEADLALELAPMGADTGTDAIDNPTMEPEAEVQKPVISDDLIEKQIAAFQEELAMSCPLCRTGKILNAETAKGKVYYSCNNPACRFVSWARPWHYECPLCKNPFLTECSTPAGSTGLQCPRSTCVYFQDNLNNPAENSAAVPQRRKRKVVRRVRRKR